MDSYHKAWQRAVALFDRHRNMNIPKETIHWRENANKIEAKHQQVSSSCRADGDRHGLACGQSKQTPTRFFVARGRQRQTRARATARPATTITAGAVEGREGICVPALIQRETSCADIACM